ncbi:uncharacterized protein LOC135333585 [Halichondria panicea]|uniref:uncharacterized protein LOC135333585 n=1 Tax=Halichondria panicea TaxID=6063 RepID=UPI00312B64EF
MALQDSEVTHLIKTTEEIKGKMVQNMTKLEERQTNLEKLDDKAKALKETGDEFKKGATKVHEKKKWEHYKLWMILISIIAIIIIVIIVVATLIALFVTKPWEKKH